MMKGLLLLLAVAVNAELSHKDRMNLVVVDQSGELVYPAREMEKVSTEITELEKMSHSLDMKLSQMEDLNLRDPEVWKKYTHAREAARTASTTLEALRERMQGLEDQYVDAEQKLKAKVEPGLLLQMPGDSALLQSGEEEDYEGEGPSKEEVEKEEAKKQQFKMIAENQADDIEEKLVETPGISREEAEEEVNEEKTWSADDLQQGEALLQEEESDQDLESEAKVVEAPKKAKLLKVETKKTPSRWQQAMSLVEIENSLVATDTDYQMALYLADQGLSMEQIADELHPVDEKEVADKAELSQEKLEEEAKRQEQTRREMVQEEQAEKNMKLLNLPANLKVKSLASKESEWRAEFLRMERFEASGAESQGRTECLNTPDEKKQHNNEDLVLKAIFYINLDRARNRAKGMEKALNDTAGNFHFERWSASTRKEANEQHYTEFSRRGKNHNQFVGKGTVATYLSHTNMLKHISTLENGVYFVLEDDSRPKGLHWAEEVMCQVKELPTDWHIYKFGYWNTGGAGCRGMPGAGQFSCRLKKHSFDFMGNQGYAVTPEGAKKMLEHLYDMPVFDIDGAMMPGQSWGGHGSKIDANYYVSKHTYMRHDQSYGSDRVRENGGQFRSIQCDVEEKKETCMEEEELKDDEDGRESSFAAKQRVVRSFLRTGKMPWEMSDKTLSKDWSRMAALV